MRRYGLGSSQSLNPRHFHRNCMLALRNLNIGRCVAHKTAVDIDISTRRIGTQRRRSNFQGNPPVTTLSEFFLEALGRRCYVLRCGEVKPKSALSRQKRERPAVCYETIG